MCDGTRLIGRRVIRKSSIPRCESRRSSPRWRTVPSRRAARRASTRQHPWMVAGSPVCPTIPQFAVLSVSFTAPSMTGTPGEGTGSLGAWRVSTGEGIHGIDPEVPQLLEKSRRIHLLYTSIWSFPWSTTYSLSAVATSVGRDIPRSPSDAPSGTETGVPSGRRTWTRSFLKLATYRSPSGPRSSPVAT